MTVVQNTYSVRYMTDFKGRNYSRKRDTTRHNTTRQL